MKPTTTLATSQTNDGTSLVLQEHDGEFFMKVGGVSLMGTNASSSEQEMAQLACGDMGPKDRVLIGGLGFGYTLRKVLELSGAENEVVVAELLPQVVDWNREYLSEVNGKLIDDPRVTIEMQDVYQIIRNAGGSRYSAILLDVDNSPDPLVAKGNARLYERRGLESIKGALTRHGRVVFWSANRDRSFEKLLSKIFRKVESIPAKAYPKAKRFTHTLFIAEN